ncbi:MAG: ABC transporter ATP-binding protein, partial [Actinobacteria bacterium]|nr:ABC transporter ATP-binding protein [Actinomycetota bacterium]
MRPTAIAIDGLWEEFKILEDRTRSLKEVVSRFRIARSKTSFFALEDVSFTVGKGETVGLLGENGSGKSTLLRCIAGILPPNRGSVLVGGTVSSLIELGAGFHPELTGRENTALSAALFGLPRSKLKERFDSIVDFAEVWDAIDHPIRSYSSGMYVRLAFSLAVHVEPEVLLIDEVLAVGDESFQRKCVARVSELAASGVTIVFVSHDLALVEQVCERSLLLEK